MNEFDEYETWVTTNVQNYRGEAVRDLMKEICASVGPDNAHDLAEIALDAYRGVYDPHRNVYYHPVVSGATLDEIRIAETWVCGFGRHMTPDDIVFCETRAEQNPLPAGIDPVRVTQFNEQMLLFTLGLRFSAPEKEVILAALGVQRNVAIVANSEIARYHLDEALADPMGEGPLMSEETVPKREA